MTLDVDRAVVYKDGVPAATLSREGSGIRFAYLPGYSGRPVATTLPVTREPVTTLAGALPPFFSGLLPEGRRLTALRHRVKTSADDELSLLLAVGADTVGDVVVLPEGESPQPVAPLIDTPDFSFTELRAATGLVEPTGIAGVQDKASGAMISLPVRLRGVEAIVKLDPPEYPHVTANEHYFLRLARRLRQPVANSELILDRDGVPGLVVERFDRVRSGDGVARVAVEDACQLAGLYPADKYRLSAAEVIRVVAGVCAAAAVARRAVFQQLVFAWLTGNGDLHAKNVSVLRAPSGEWRVAPMYDLPSTLPYGDTRAALTVAGSRENLTRRTFLRLAEEVGLPERAANGAIDEALRATAPLVDDIEAGAFPLPRGNTRTLVRQLRRRRADLDH
ncbi:type II toxin-antitoxin system HipA family toxin [Tessaracoccus oleiagri]|uniref:Serine/threonine-protein kinase HipA n=1 Tax=Tessaracoccus oleiagri TaxID=686624 RepID=A0A1G9HPW0_9ACTN|nr:HipA domain-containing protein [Tessaracoccus oleiagri]SDL14583.1 serine/threonine-protein kinase HipA [Tessaracoccus oleiagri]